MIIPAHTVIIVDVLNRHARRERIVLPTPRRHDCKWKYRLKTCHVCSECEISITHLHGRRRVEAEGIASRVETPDERLAVNGLLHLLRRADDSQNRLARASKRVKTSFESSANSSSGSATPNESEDFDWHDHSYPDLSRSNVNEPIIANAETTPVLQHVFHVQYTQEGYDAVEGWTAEEENLLEILADLRTSEPRTIDLGDINVTSFQNRLVVFSPFRAHKWCLLLPPHDDEIDLAWHGFSTHRVSDVLMASHMLRSTGRTRMRTRLRLVVLPLEMSMNDELPFKLEVEVDVSLQVPTIFEEPPWKKGKAAELEDAQRRLFTFLYPSEHQTPESYNGITNIPFFYSILRPAPQLASAPMQEALQPKDLLPTLLPFQRRSVGWLLAREGKTITPNGEVVPLEQSSEFSFWETVQEGNATWYLNRLTGSLSPSPPQPYHALGGILAEEPGLGKTLESISLILLNPAPPERNPSMIRWDPEARLEVKAIKTTLIVTPPTLASQWADELAAHAPSLKVLLYDGWSKVTVPITRAQVAAAKVNILQKRAKAMVKSLKSKKKSKSDDMDIDSDVSMDVDVAEPEVQGWCEYVNTFDVVITTYPVLRTDFNVALAAPVRPRRENVVYSTLTIERARSPLVTVEWYRVLMDEVQMVGGGKVEFLRVHDVIGSSRLWNRLVSTGLGAAHFAELFQTYGIRTLKQNVKDELTIPQQTRYLVSIKISPVEKLVYDQALETLLLELGLDARGVAATEDWEVDTTILRSAIRRLRGICTHPQVGQLQRPGEKVFKAGAVKTIDDVLQNNARADLHNQHMREMNWRAMMDHRKAKIYSLIRMGQLQTHDETDPQRFKRALDSLLEAEREAQALVNEAQAALDKYIARKKHQKNAHGDKDEVELSDKAKGKRRQITEGDDNDGEGREEEESLDSDDDSDDEDDLLGKVKGSGERSKKRGALQNRLRECRITLHKAKFLQGDMYHALGETRLADEEAAYGTAETIRRSLLKGTEDDATRAMELINKDADKKQLTEESLMIDVPLLDNSDLCEISDNLKPTKEEAKAKPVPFKVTMYNRVTASLELIEEVNSMVADVLNDQSTLLWEWRSQITALLTQKLASSEDSPDGEEYQRTLDNQGEAETYLRSYATLLSDRRQALSNERTLLAAHDAREKRLRHTKAAANAATTLVLESLPGKEGEDEIEPEHEVLNERTTDALMDKLDADLALLRKAFNQRILYFRQLQEISDTVAEVEWEGTILDALLESTRERDNLETEINKSRAQTRYLDNLTKKKDEGMFDEDDECCILCRCEFIRGFITRWLVSSLWETLFLSLTSVLPAPMSSVRVPVDPDTVQRFITKTAKEEALPPEAKKVEPVPKSRRQISYNMIEPALFAEINAIESFGDYGSKIQTLVRHLLFLKHTEPDAKSIVFSAWADSLFIMERALTSNGMRAASLFTAPSSYVKNRHTLMYCSKVKGRMPALTSPAPLEYSYWRASSIMDSKFKVLVFPQIVLDVVLNTHFSSAIARIDRMGQTRPTEDTVERNILDLAARQGLSLYTKENSAGTLNVAALSTDADAKIANSPKKLKKTVQKGDFISNTDDMLAILFPHMYEELQFLIPEDESMAIPIDNANSNVNSIPQAAGPSRLQ
ncbi:hypothetical protein H0H93_011044 [Arthromyces matolae]|nr:hypothetical protein H0H93_011044 [Arthromyces matolae]